MIQMNLTLTQFNSVSAFLDLIENRAKEETNKKSININAFSISKHLQADYTSVKCALKNLHKKTKEIKENVIR